MDPDCMISISIELIYQPVNVRCLYWPQINLITVKHCHYNYYYVLLWLSGLKS